MLDSPTNWSVEVNRIYTATRGDVPKRAKKPSQPNELRGTPTTGRIAKIMVGQGHGFIRSGSREIYFHRADLQEGTMFNALQVGDNVKFELLEDNVSGARALKVAPIKKRK